MSTETSTALSYLSTKTSTALSYLSTETSTALSSFTRSSAVGINVSYFDCMYCGGLDIESTLRVDHVLGCQLRTWKMGNSIRSESIRNSQRGGELFVDLLENPDLTANLPFSNSVTYDPCSFISSDPPNFELYMDKFKKFNKEKNFSILHLNIASLLSK